MRPSKRKTPPNDFNVSFYSFLSFHSHSPLVHSHKYILRSPISHSLLKLFSARCISPGAVMESETAAAFSFSGADREIVTSGSETFVPAFSFLTDLHSNQMLVSHCNQMDFCSVLPIHPAQFSREIYDIGSTQYSNMPFSANLNAPGAKTGVPTKRSVPVPADRGCPTQDSLHSPRGGISHFWSNSGSDEAEEQQVMDEKKQRRMLSNRESARRSRLRKQQHWDELRDEVDHLRAENGQILKKINITSQHYAHVSEENWLLRSQGLELSQKLQRLQHTLNSQSHGVFDTVGAETRNCSAAHMSSAYGTIAHPWASHHLWS